MCFACSEYEQFYLRQSETFKVAEPSKATKSIQGSMGTQGIKPIKFIQGSMGISPIKFIQGSMGTQGISPIKFIQGIILFRQ